MTKREPRQETTSGDKYRKLIHHNYAIVTTTFQTPVLPSQISHTEQSKNKKKQYTGKRTNF